jgi:CRP-like cAMP-binding protein
MHALSSGMKVYMAGDDDSPYRAHLSKTPIFGSCTSEQLDRLAELGDTRTAGDSDVVVREGDKGGTFFLITSGRARVTRGGREVDLLGPGDSFGELSLFDPAPRDASITAVGPLSLVALSRVAFMQALNEIPTFRDSLLHGMARRLHELDQRV